MAALSRSCAKPWRLPVVRRSQRGLQRRRTGISATVGTRRRRRPSIRSEKNEREDERGDGVHGHSPERRSTTVRRRRVIASRPRRGSPAPVPRFRRDPQAEERAHGDVVPRSARRGRAEGALERAEPVVADVDGGPAALKGIASARQARLPRRSPSRASISSSLRFLRRLALSESGSHGSPAGCESKRSRTALSTRSPMSRIGEWRPGRRGRVCRGGGGLSPRRRLSCLRRAWRLSYSGGVAGQAG